MKVGDHIEMTTSHRSGADSLLLLAGRRGVIQKSSTHLRVTNWKIHFPEDKLGKLIWDGETTDWVPAYKMRLISPLILLAECADA